MLPRVAERLDARHPTIGGARLIGL